MLRPVRLLRPAWVLLLAIGVLPTAADVPLPVPSKGQINGRTAMIAMPAAGGENTAARARPGVILSPEDCQAHLTPVANLEQELTYPCGKWFQPPQEGNYRIWLEKPAMISEGYGLLMWEDEPFPGKGLSMIMPLEPAGTIALAPAVPIAEGQSFRFVHLRAVHKGTLRPAFDRRLPATRAREGGTVAIGSVLAGIFDRKTDHAVALARPVEVRAGKTSYVAPAPPPRGTDVLAVLARPRPAKLGSHEVTVGLRIDGSVKKPDVLLASASNIFAVWYGVEGAEATLLAESSTLQLAPTAVKLTPGKVATVRTKLSKRPGIAVSIGGPDEILRDRRMTLELRSEPGDDLLQKLDAAPNAEFRFDGLTAAAYQVVVVIDEWEIRRKVVLEPDRDEEVMFTLSPIVVSGSVYHGRDLAPGAEIAFDVGRRGWMRTKANEQGRYETIFWQPGEYIAEIKVPGRPGPPFWDGIFDIRQSDIIDFHVPNTHFVVNVRDGVTGKPIAGAKVLAGSAYEGRQGSGRSLQTAVTDETGRAMLPPMRPGEMTIRATAEGYFDSDVTQNTVDRTDADGEFDIALRPVGETIAVKLRNPDGTAAAGAAVWAVRSTGGRQRPLWKGITDNEGVVAVPRAMRTAFFLIRPRMAASAIRRLDGDDDVVWSLSPAAALTLHAGRRSRIAVWIDDVRVSGDALALVMGGLEATDENGNWSSSSLPPRPLRVLAWRTAALEAVDSGAYDLAATQLQYPWPRVVELQPVD